LGIRANCVGPGFIDAGLGAELIGTLGAENFIEGLRKTLPLNASVRRRTLQMQSHSCCPTAPAILLASPSLSMEGFNCRRAEACQAVSPGMSSASASDPTCDSAARRLSFMACMTSSAMWIWSRVMPRMITPLSRRPTSAIRSITE
jgi:hypothetical protein